MGRSGSFVVWVGVKLGVVVRMAVKLGEM